MQTPLLRLMSFSRATNFSFSSFVIASEFFSLSFLMSPIRGRAFFFLGCSWSFYLVTDLERPCLSIFSYCSILFYLPSNLASSF